MHWILWTMLLFQDREKVYAAQAESSLRSLDSTHRDDLAREASITGLRSGRQKVTAETTRRAQAAALEKQFLDRYNRLMKAMLQFAESYNDRHAIDAKLLQAVRKAVLDLQKHDTLFRDDGKE